MGWGICKGLRDSFTNILISNIMFNSSKRVKGIDTKTAMM